MKTLHLRTTIGPDGTIGLHVPGDLPPEETDVVLRLHEFKPSKTTVEKGDIEKVVGEFGAFLEKAVDGDRKSQFTILAINKLSTRGPAEDRS